MATERYAMLFETLPFFEGVYFHSIRLDGMFKLNVLMFIVYTHTHTLLDDIKWRLKLMRFCSKSRLSFSPIFHCSGNAAGSSLPRNRFRLNSVNHYLSSNENTCAHAQSHFCQQNCQLFNVYCTCSFICFMYINEWVTSDTNFILLFVQFDFRGTAEIWCDWARGVNERKIYVCFQIIFHTMKIGFLVCMSSWCLFLGLVLRVGVRI